MIFHMCGCATLVTDAGRVSPCVLLEIDHRVRTDKLRRRARRAGGQPQQQQVRPPEHPRLCLRPLAARYGLEDLSGLVVMMRTF